MKYCPRCGVELAGDAVRCVLCGRIPVTEKPAAAEAAGVAYPSGDVAAGSFSDVEIGADAFASVVRNSLSEAERRRVAVELLAVCFGGALMVTCLIDVFMNKAFTWSLHSSLGIVSAWMVFAMPLILFGYPWILYAVLAPFLVLSVFLFTVFTGSMGTFLRYGLPISLAFDGIAAGLMAIVSAFKRRGLNAMAVFLCGIVVFCFVVEFIVDLNAGKTLAPGWSVIVAIALIPAAGFLFYLHYRIVDQASLRKLFRL
jgi:hypothetical protein